MDLSHAGNRLTPKRLRVVYVTQDDLSKNSGYVFRVDRLRRAIEAAGHSVEVVGFSSGEPVIESTVRRSTSPMRRLWPLLAGLLRPADCVVITSIGAPYNGIYSVVQRLLGRRVVYDCHDPVLATVPRLYNLGILRPLIMRYIAFSEYIVARCADVTFAAAPSQAQELRALHDGRSVVLFYNIGPSSNGYRAPATRIREEAGWGDATVVVYAGGLQPIVRGIEPQVEAVRRARAAGVRVSMLVLGFGNRLFVERLAGSLISDGTVRIEDDVPPDQLRAALEQCDVAISSDPWRYGMQSKIFDYLRSGVRVFAIDDDRDVVRTFPSLVQRYDGTVDDLVRVLMRRPNRLSETERIQATELIASMERASHEEVSRAFAAIARS
jgi:hypothetical protein